ncbi:SPOR domain-containing protein [Crenobacter sp. SG2303]|uniref:SPOR domain-containing protein n=1 Tax=Crenobacter oryzisoli TaxID=3056844 RepID=A0ABT7XUS6_9NEIS|nr:SPOR domain-containing protein [Crenobacter sp. SG2303]MDN0077527.1 SPOR domain-containing protein [Crenobacter sp. SG2303]
MKWFFAIVLVLNLLVFGYGNLKARVPVDLHAQEVNAKQVKLLPANWTPPVASAAVAEASAPTSGTALPVGLDAATVAAAKPAAPAPVTKLADAKPAETKPVDSKLADSKPVAAHPKVETKPIAPQSTVPQPVAAAPAPAPAPTKVANRCYSWGALNETLYARVKGGLPGLKLSAAQWRAESQQAPSKNSKYWVFYPAQATAAESHTLAAELKGKGFDNYPVNDGEFKGTLSLGLFANESGADTLLAKLKAAGFTNAKVQPRGKGATQTVLHFKDLDGAQSERLVALQHRLTPGIAVQGGACAG